MKKYKYIGVLAFVLCCFFPVFSNAVTTLADLEQAMGIAAEIVREAENDVAEAQEAVAEIVGGVEFDEEGEGLAEDNLIFAQEKFAEAQNRFAEAEAAVRNFSKSSASGTLKANRCECEAVHTVENDPKKITRKIILQFEKNLKEELVKNLVATDATIIADKKVTKDSCSRFNNMQYSVLRTTDGKTEHYTLFCSVGVTGGAYDGPKTVKLDNPLGKDLSIPELTGKIVRYLLGIIGAVVFVVFFIGGFFWMTSAGNPEKVKKGSSTMLYAVIGLFVIFSAYGIINMFLTNIAK